MGIDRIEIDPIVMPGKPMIRGTRIPVELILRKLGEGTSEADLLDVYPNLSREDIRAALVYAANSLAQVEVRQTLHIYSPRLAHPEQADDFKMEVIEEPSSASL